jgi:hypothetical protein
MVTILVAIGGYYINDYWWIFCLWLLVDMFLVAIGRYYINAY